MIIYNTLMGVCAGVGLILVAALYRRLATPTDAARGDRRSWAAVFAVLGTALTVLGGLMSVTWPLTVNPPINIVFGEPSLLFGLFLLGAAVYLWRTADRPTRPVDLTPVNAVVFATGLVLASCAAAIVRFRLVGGAPALEPITGRIGHLPWIENTFFGILYGLPALGALLAPLAGLADNRLARLVRWCWTASGVLFLGFAALNYYTHIGFLINVETGTSYRW